MVKHDKIYEGNIISSLNRHHPINHKLILFINTGYQGYKAVIKRGSSNRVHLIRFSQLNRRDLGLDMVTWYWSCDRHSVILFNQGSLYPQRYGQRHAKRSLMAWVGVIPKDGRARTCPSFGMTPIFKLFFLDFWIFFFFLFFLKFPCKSQCHAKGMWPHVAAPTLLLVWRWLRPLATFLCDTAHTNILYQTRIMKQLKWVCIWSWGFWLLVKTASKFFY